MEGAEGKKSYFQQCILCKLYVAGQELKWQFGAIMAHCSCSETWCSHCLLHLELPSHTDSVSGGHCLPSNSCTGARQRSEEVLSPLCHTLCRSSRVQAVQLQAEVTGVQRALELPEPGFAPPQVFLGVLWGLSSSVPVYRGTADTFSLVVTCVWSQHSSLPKPGCDQSCSQEILDWKPRQTSHASSLTNDLERGWVREKGLKAGAQLDTNLPRCTACLSLKLSPCKWETGWSHSLLSPSNINLLEQRALLKAIPYSHYVLTNKTVLVRAHHEVAECSFFFLSWSRGTRDTGE